MKKVLFTLAALCAFGIASAEVAPELGFRTNDNEAITEVTMNPGVSIESMVMPMVSGMQAQWRAFDVNHDPINYDITNKCAPGKVYGSRVKSWFEGIEAGTSDESVGGFDGVGIGTAMPYENVYRIMATNTKYNMTFFRWADDAETVENCPMNIGHFTLVASADWDEEFEFATFELDLEYTLWNQCPGYDPAVFEEAYNTNPMILKIKNGAYVPPTPEPIPLTGEIVIGDPDEDGYVTVEYTGEEEGLTIRVMIDGVYVPLTDGKVFLGAYGEATITVEVSGEGYETLTAEKTVNWEEPVLADLEGEIIINGPDENGVITVTYTGSEEVTVTVKVNGEVVEGEIVLPEGDNVVEVTVEAEGYNPLTKTETINYTAPVPVEKTETPVINVEEYEDAVVVTAVGEGEVKLYVNGEEVENPYTILKGDEPVTYTITATAKEDGKEISDEATLTLTVDAYVAPYETPAPELTTEVTDEAVVITATGEGTVTLYIQYIDNETGDLTLETYVGEGTVSHEVARGEEVTYVNFWAVAQANDDAVPGFTGVTYYFEIPALETPQPEVTPTPVITYEVTDDAVIITATGEGEVLLYVNGELVDNPVTIARGNTDVVVTVTATAQGEDMLISETATQEITIPALAGGEEPDEHMTGYWLVTIDKNNNEVWNKMVTGADHDGYQTNVALTYTDYGSWDYAALGEEGRFNVKFYVMIDGVRYACEVDGTVPEWGDANQNPLYENENFWGIPVGYKYVIGVVYNQYNQRYYLQISKGIFVGVGEVDADKTVAGVRYFNMAGQEMSEANGMTIVVTTYTDGTTSAVKVMK